MFLSFQARRSSATRSSTSDLTVVSRTRPFHVLFLFEIYLVLRGISLEKKAVPSVILCLITCVFCSFIKSSMLADSESYCSLPAFPQVFQIFFSFFFFALFSHLGNKSFPIAQWHAVLPPAGSTVARQPADGDVRHGLTWRRFVNAPRRSPGEQLICEHVAGCFNR